MQAADPQYIHPYLKLTPPPGVEFEYLCRTPIPDTFALILRREALHLLPLISDICLWLLVPFGLWLLFRLGSTWRRPQLPGRPHCRRCNYCVEGVTSSRCPECGHDLKRNARGRTRLRRLIVPAAACVLLGGLGAALNHKTGPYILGWRYYTTAYSPWLAREVTNRDIKLLERYIEPRALELRHLKPTGDSQHVAWLPASLRFGWALAAYISPSTPFPSSSCRNVWTTPSHDFLCMIQDDKVLACNLVTGFYRLDRAAGAILVGDLTGGDYQLNYGRPDGSRVLACWNPRAGFVKEAAQSTNQAALLAIVETPFGDTVVHTEWTWASQERNHICRAVTAAPVPLPELEQMIGVSVDWLQVRGGQVYAYSFDDGPVDLQSPPALASDGCLRAELPDQPLQRQADLPPLQTRPRHTWSPGTMVCVMGNFSSHYEAWEASQRYAATMTAFHQPFATVRDVLWLFEPEAAARYPEVVTGHDAPESPTPQQRAAAKSLAGVPQRELPVE